MARITRLEEREGRWYFLFRPDALEDFSDVLKRVKCHIPPEERAWHASETRWSVSVSEDNHARLTHLFTNFPSEVAAMANQLDLFSVEGGSSCLLRWSLS